MKNNVLFFSILIIIVILASLYASTQPDGLEYIAAKIGFLNQDISHKSFFPDYTVPLLGSTSISTVLAGIAGVFLCSIVFVVWALLFSVCNKPEQ